VGDSQIVEIEGRRLTVTNLEKVMYPATGFTKGQLIDYYLRIAPVLVPHLKGRALTLKRYPGGVDQKFFFEKNATPHRPDWIKTAPIWSESNHRQVHYILAEDLATLVWIANLAAIELHPSLALVEDITRPRAMVFDLDPGPPASLLECCQVGLWLRDIFAHFGLKSFPKTSGSKGLQVYLPLNLPTHYDVTKAFAHALARLLENEHPQLVVSDMKKQLRQAKVLVDWSQNDEHKTTVSVYSLRAREHPTVSTPLSWEEVELAWRKQNARGLVFEAQQVLERVHSLGDLFAPLLALKQKLPALATELPSPGAKASVAKSAILGQAEKAQAEKRQAEKERTEEEQKSTKQKSSKKKSTKKKSGKK
jgi:bifunctional non-homologous end joining protein LigD